MSQFLWSIDLKGNPNRDLYLALPTEGLLAMPLRR